MDTKVVAIFQGHSLILAGEKQFSVQRSAVTDDTFKCEMTSCINSLEHQEVLTMNSVTH